MVRTRNLTLTAIARELRALGYGSVRTHKGKIHVHDADFTLSQRGTIIKLVDGWGAYDQPLVAMFDLLGPDSLDRLFQTIDKHYPVGECTDDEE